MIPISQRVEHYLAQRKRLGTGLSAAAVLVLQKFGEFAETQGAKHVTRELFLHWMDHYGSAGRKSWSYRYSHVRTFSMWLHSLDPASEILPKGLVPAVRNRPKPYIYTDEEIADIIDAAAALHPTPGNRLRGLTHATLFGLIAVTGLRISEALHLHDADVDIGAATLRIRHAKNDARRVMPLAPCTAARLAEYLEVRDRVIIRQAPNLFLGKGGKPLSVYMAEYAYARCCQITGLRARQANYRHGNGPRIHDMRHSFAVKTIIDWHRAGRDVDREIYKLSAWLGHASPESTYWYLEAVPELLRIAVRKAELAHRQGRPS